MARMNLGKMALVAAALVIGTTVTAQAQWPTSNTATVTLNATRAAGITVSTDVSALSIASVTDNSAANSFGSVAVTTYYTVGANAGGNLTLVGYFDTPTQALANGTDYLPSSTVVATIGGVSAPFAGAAVGAVGTAGGSLTLGSWNVPALGDTQTRLTNVGLSLNLTGRNTKVGTYTGVLNLRAIFQ